MENLFFKFRSFVIILLFSCSFIPSAKSQRNSEGDSPQFLYPDFTDGRVKMKNGQSQNIQLNYNTVSEKMVFQKNENIYDLVNTELIDTVFIGNSRFVPSGKVFYELLLTATVPLFVQYQGELISPGAPAGYGVNSQVSNTKLASSVQLSSGYYNLKLPEDFDVKVSQIYWVRKNGEMVTFMNERQFLKVFQEKESELKSFIKQNKIKFAKMSDVVAITKYCNEILK